MRSICVFSHSIIIKLTLMLIIALGLSSISYAYAQTTETTASTANTDSTQQANIADNSKSHDSADVAIGNALGVLLKPDISSSDIVADPLNGQSQNKNNHHQAEDAHKPFIPTHKYISERLANLDKDPSLNAIEKEQTLAFLKRMQNRINLYDSLDKEEEMINSELIQSNAMIGNLEQALSEANNVYSQDPPDIKIEDIDEINALINQLSVQQTKVQAQLNDATSAYNSLQTLPSRAQNQITANNTELFEITKRINDPTIRLLPDEVKLLPFESYVLNKQNNLLQTELKSLNIFQDIANYKIRINSLHRDYINKYLAKARNKQNTLMSSGVISNSNDQKQNTTPIPAKLATEVKSNTELTSNIDKILVDNAKLKRDLQSVTEALNTAHQIEKNIQEQLSDLSGSVILSRLLNRQQSELPKLSISFKLDELIPNLNLWMYELRRYREQIFDVQSYVDQIIRNDKGYEPYREQLVQLIRHRRSLYDELYNAMSDGLTLAIELRAKYNEFNSTTSRLKTVINDHLFWLTSNQGISVEFFINLYPTLILQLRDLTRYLSSETVIEETLTNYLKLLIPVIILGLIFQKAHPYFRRLSNELALRLDKDSDGYSITPKALFCHCFLILPKMIVITLIGAIFIFLILDRFEDQKHVTLLLALHLMCFLYMRQIMEPNSLMQRHFSMAPSIIKQNRMLVDQIWYVSIPMLTIANMREVEPNKISGDVIGYILMLLGFLYLTFFAIVTVKRMLTQYTPTMTVWALSIVGILTPLTIVIMLGLGYYYTVIQLLNRVAITLYIGFAYLIISNTLRRELYVAEIKILRKIRQKVILNQDNDQQAHSNTNANSFGARFESFRLELVNNRAFKLFNAILLTISVYFMYLQWNDLAGVLTYLDKIYLWQNVNVVDGKTITSSLSFGDILLAIVIVIVAVVLNHNLPMLIERLFMLRSGVAAKSTSYTIKLITSYVITGLGIIFAAGALGISWDNLQWLVAALSVGLGFGLQEIFANFVSGLIILFERQIRVGDIVTISNLSGTVNKIRIRATTIVSFDNKEVVIPNRQFITTALTNWSLSNTVTKIEFAIGIAYDADPNKAKDILRGIIRRCRDLNREKKPVVFIKSLDASAVTIMCEVFVNEIGKRKAVYDYLSTETLRLFKDHNIEIPFDQLDVTIRNLDNDNTVSYSQKDMIKAAAMGAARKKAALPIVEE